jgi:hypothetical protein
LQPSQVSRGPDVDYLAVVLPRGKEPLFYPIFSKLYRHNLLAPEDIDRKTKPVTKAVLFRGFSMTWVRT